MIYFLEQFLVWACIFPSGQYLVTCTIPNGSSHTLSYLLFYYLHVTLQDLFIVASQFVSVWSKKTWYTIRKIIFSVLSNADYLWHWTLQKKTPLTLLSESHVYITICNHFLTMYFEFMACWLGFGSVTTYNEKNFIWHKTN